MSRHAAVGLAALAAMVALAGCAFDVSKVQTEPTSFTPATGCAPGWTLTEDVSIGLGTGFPTRLRKNTRWRCVGDVAQGRVFQTDDQIVTVEASNIHEARAVMRDGRLVGFYLIVERRFAPVSPPVILPARENAP